MKWLLLILILVAACRQTAVAATINAATVSRTDVGTAVTSASDGDTVVIPAGTADWTTTLTISKAITLQGNGVGSTIITLGVSVGQSLIVWNLVSNLNSRMTGIEIQKGSVGGNYVQAINANGLNSDGRRFRIDHCKFTHIGQGAFNLNTVLGVGDHVTVVNSNAVTAYVGYVKGSSWNSTLGANNYGDGAWADGDRFGTTNFFYFEDCVFSNSYPQHLTTIDSQAGGRYVVRNSKIYNGSLESHGLEAQRERSGRAFEIYNNTFDGIDTQDFITYFRGGVALVYSNYVYGYNTTPKMSLLVNRLHDNLASPFNGTDGRNPWDSNDVANPYVTGTASSAGALTMTDSGKSWTVNQWVGYMLRRSSGKSVSSMTRSGSTVTVNCTSHGFTNGQIVSICGASQQAYNAVQAITVSDANTFTFSINYTPATPATGTIYAVSGTSFSEILSNTSTQLTFADSIYAGGYTMVFTAGDPYEINKVIKSMDMPGLGQGSLLSGDTPSIPGAWNDQAISPWYQWNNVKCSSGPAAIGASGTGINFSAVPLLLLVNGIHYSNSVAKPGYTAYTYPHPLVNNAPTISSITIDSTGTNITVQLSTSCTNGPASGNDWAPSMNGNGTGATWTYFSGSGGSTFVLHSDKVHWLGNTGSMTYSQPGNGVKDLSGVELPTQSGIVVINNSTVTFPIRQTSSLSRRFQ